MEAKKTTSSVHEVGAEDPPFGSRYVISAASVEAITESIVIRFLTDKDDVWAHNAWDHVPPPEDQAEIIAASLARQKGAPVPDDEKVKYNEKPAKHWCDFSFGRSSFKPTMPLGTTFTKTMQPISSVIANGAIIYCCTDRIIMKHACRLHNEFKELVSATQPEVSSLLSPSDDLDMMIMTIRLDR